ncbi:hypothetical protein [Bradyrhizobium sp. UFLA05-112]
MNRPFRHAGHRPHLLDAKGSAKVELTELRSVVGEKWAGLELIYRAGAVHL